MPDHVCPVCTLIVRTAKGLTSHVIAKHMLTKTRNDWYDHRHVCFCQYQTGGGRSGAMAMRFHLRRRGGIAAHFLEHAMGVQDDY